jgi:hypothetical protein
VPNNGLINFFAIVQCYAHPSLQCTSRPPSYLFQQHFWHLNGSYDLNSAFEKMSTDYYNKIVQAVCFTTLRYKANLCWHLPEEIFFSFFLVEKQKTCLTETKLGEESFLPLSAAKSRKSAATVAT